MSNSPKTVEFEIDTVTQPVNVYRPTRSHYKTVQIGDR